MDMKRLSLCAGAAMIRPLLAQTVFTGLNEARQRDEVLARYLAQGSSARDTMDVLLAPLGGEAGPPATIGLSGSQRALNGRRPFA